MTDSTNPTDYNYFLDSNGDVWRQPTEGGLYEVMAPGSWSATHRGRHIVLLPLTPGKPILPTEPGLYVVNYSDALATFAHSIVYLARAGAEWRYYADDIKWNPRGGDTLTRLDVAEGEK